MFRAAAALSTAAQQLSRAPQAARDVQPALSSARLGAAWCLRGLADASKPAGSAGGTAAGQASSSGAGAGAGAAGADAHSAKQAKLFQKVLDGAPVIVLPPRFAVAPHLSDRCSNLRCM